MRHFTNLPVNISNACVGRGLAEVQPSTDCLDPDCGSRSWPQLFAVYDDDLRSVWYGFTLRRTFPQCGIPDCGPGSGRWRSNMYQRIPKRNDESFLCYPPYVRPQRATSHGLQRLRWSTSGRRKPSMADCRQ